MKNKTAKNVRQPATPRMDLSGPGMIEIKRTLPKACSVAVVGTFNGWDPNRTPLNHEGAGVWRIFLPLAAGRYEYRFVVDGQWQEDPDAKEFVPNPFGGRNAVLTVAGGARRVAQPAVAA